MDSGEIVRPATGSKLKLKRLTSHGVKCLIPIKIENLVLDSQYNVVGDDQWAMLAMSLVRHKSVHFAYPRDNNSFVSMPNLLEIGVTSLIDGNGITEAKLVTEHLVNVQPFYKGDTAFFDLGLQLEELGIASFKTTPTGFDQPEVLCRKAILHWKPAILPEIEADGSYQVNLRGKVWYVDYHGLIYMSNPEDDVPLANLNSRLNSYFADAKMR